jgi:uncharacterized protein YciI
MANPEKYYVLFCVTAYRSIADAKSNAPNEIAAHVARSRELYARRKVLMAGAFLDNPDEPLTTMGVFSSREDAEQYAAGDPFVINGMVTKYYIREWANILA